MAGPAGHWEVTLEGFANLSLRDTSRHLTNPHGALEIAPNALSFFDYAGAAAGIGPIVTVFDHPAIPGHFDRYVMSTTIAGPITGIHFDGSHVEPTQPKGEGRGAVPEPSTYLLFSIGLAGLLGYAGLRRWFLLQEKWILAGASHKYDGRTHHKKTDPIEREDEHLAQWGQISDHSNNPSGGVSSARRATMRTTWNATSRWWGGVVALSFVFLLPLAARANLIASPPHDHDAAAVT